MRRLFYLLTEEVLQIPRFRVFITTRPEPHIRSVFEQDHNHHYFHLHDIALSIVVADIRSYLEFRLSTEQVQKTLPDLRHPIWQPTKEQTDTLVRMSGKLFIIAATVASFILDRKQVDPAGQLAVLLSNISVMGLSGSNPMMAMDEVYMGIIRTAQPDPVGKWIDRFQACVGAIILLHDPLPCDALAQLIDVDIGVVLGTLANLHSLLAPSETTQTFRVHHISFPDFISDLDRCVTDPRLCIDRTAHHLRLARHCLHIIDRLLISAVSSLASGTRTNSRYALGTKYCLVLRMHAPTGQLIWSPHWRKEQGWTRKWKCFSSALHYAIFYHGWRR